MAKLHVVVQAMLEDFASLDILVNNAGILQPGSSIINGKY
jgi:NAD(P)-dependent dehydrogenase (short-subunit alcohol dehydrogenase family)